MTTQENAAVKNVLAMFRGAGLNAADTWQLNGMQMASGDPPSYGQFDGVLIKSAQPTTMMAMSAAQTVRGALDGLERLAAQPPVDPV